ncbi:hypothetical protein IEQ34_007915 [Dendrobium chrysotoxum]|uniref:Uncharacterized protein n=1 Tax=Dendrobium chrysotoxum TaxID=161865 RepID=A0AAV7H5S0_DENCH|nr:hypothetical protein IEQ34_007915 [Dendrobium chrysotoxum]
MIRGIDGIKPSTYSQTLNRLGCFDEPCHGIEGSKWAIFGKQNWRCGMNRKPVTVPNYALTQNPQRVLVD